VTNKRPAAAQVEPSEKAAATKAVNAAKRSQPSWLRQQSLTTPPSIESPAAPEQLSAAHRSQGPPRLLSKIDVLVITGTSFPTIWAWMARWEISAIAHSRWSIDVALD